MRVYIAGVGSERQYTRSQRSFERIRTRPGDVSEIKFERRGDINRIILCKDFLASDADAIYLVDLDMTFHPNVLERLRTHDVDMVTGHYFRRQIKPMLSICSVSEDGTWPYHPLADIPRKGMHKVISTGMGNVLIQRSVVEAVQGMLPPGASPFAIGPMPEMVHGDHGNFGADTRFFSLAHKAGFQLWLDAHPECEAEHAATVWLNRDLYDILRTSEREAMAKYWEKTFHAEIVNG